MTMKTTIKQAKQILTAAENEENEIADEIMNDVAENIAQAKQHALTVSIVKDEIVAAGYTFMQNDRMIAGVLYTSYGFSANVRHHFYSDDIDAVLTVSRLYTAGNKPETDAS